MIRVSRPPLLVLCALALACLSACKEETKVVYSERIALLPDASGLLVKEVRADAQGKQSLALLESRNGAQRELAVLPMQGAGDPRFRFAVRKDTIVLFHAEPAMQAALAGAVTSAAFPIRFEQVESGRWLTVGTEEGHAIFYAPDKWKAFLELSRGE
jgi:hypothetical protein